MSDLDPAHETSLRKLDHSSLMYLAVHVPSDVFSATVKNNEARGAMTIEYENVVGTDANAKVGQIVWFGTTAGDNDIGVARIRSITPGSDVMSIDEQDLDLAIGDDITVKKLWLPRSKLPSIDVTGADVVFKKDQTTYSDENLYIPPVVNMGPPAAALIDSGTGKATVRFVDEYVWYPSGAAEASAVWDYDGGTLVSGAGTAADPFIVTYDTAGWYWVSLTVTDDSASSQVKVGWRPVYIWDASNLPYVDFEASPRENSLSGTRQNFAVFGDAAQTDFPDGAWVIRFNRDWYGGTEEVLETRYPWRGNVKYVGYLKGGTVRVADDMSSVSFETEDITYKLDGLPGFGDVLTYDSTPLKWTEMADLDAIKAVYHVLERHTTVLDICDFRYNLPMALTEAIVREQRWGKDSILRQCNLVLEEKGIFAHLCATVQGCLEIRQDPCLMKTSDRAGTLVKVTDLLQSDFADINIDRQPYHKVHLLRVGGFSYDGAIATPLLAKSPGVPDPLAVLEAQRDGLILSPTDAQGGLNRIAGDLAAKMDNPLPRVTLELVGNYDVWDAALQERATFPLAAADNIRGLEFTDADNWIVREASITEDAAGGFVRGVSITLEAETDGGDGLEIAVPLPGDDDWPNPPTPDPPTNPPDPGGSAIDGGRRMMATDVGVLVTDEVGEDAHWYLVNDGLSHADDLYVEDIKRDPFRWWTGTERTLWAATRSGLWCHGPTAQDPTDVSFPDGTWRQILVRAAMLTDIGRTEDGNVLYACELNMSIEVEGRIAYIGNYEACGDGANSHTGVWVINAGAITNSTELERRAAWQCSGCNVEWAQHSAGLVAYACTTIDTCHVTNHRNNLYRTVDAGVDTWPALTSYINPKGRTPTLSIPYVDADNDDLFVFHGSGYWCAGQSGFSQRISIDAGVSFATVPGTDFDCMLSTWLHPDLVFLWAYAPNVSECRWSSDRGLSWTKLPLITDAVSGLASFVTFEGSALDTAMVGGALAGAAAVYRWSASTNAWADATGNLADFSPTLINAIDRDTTGVA